MCTGVAIHREYKFILFNFFSILRILLASLHLKILLINFLLTFIGSHCQSSTFDESTVTPSFPKVVSNFSSRSSFLILSGKSEIPIMTPEIMTVTPALTFKGNYYAS